MNVSRTDVRILHALDSSDALLYHKISWYRHVIIFRGMYVVCTNSSVILDVQDSFTFGKRRSQRGVFVQES
jgi:hypothetical protein